jgi:hypothetical protein
VTRAQFWMLNGASLLVAALIGFEIHSVHQLDDVTMLLQKAQAPLVAAQQQAPQIQQMIQRTAVGATRDPALKELLEKYGISVTVNPGSATANAASIHATTPSAASSATVGAQVSNATAPPPGPP